MNFIKIFLQKVFTQKENPKNITFVEFILILESQNKGPWGYRKNQIFLQQFTLGQTVSYPHINLLKRRKTLALLLTFSSLFVNKFEEFLG